MQARTLTHLIAMTMDMHSSVAATAQVTPANSNDTLLIEAAQLRGIPAFIDALRTYTASLSHFRETNRMLTKLVSREQRFRVLSWLLYFDADRERFGDDGGASYGRLSEICQRKNISPRVLKTMLTLLRFTGFVDVRRGAVDRRQTFYHPTDRMRAFARKRLGHTASALDLLEPSQQRAAALRDDPDFLDRFLVRSGRAALEDASPVDRMPEFMAFFARRDGSAAIIFAIMLTSSTGVASPSQAQIAKRYGLSKTQVANVIAEGVALGYFTRDDTGAPAVTPLLADSYKNWISIELAFFARHMQPR